MKRIVVTGATSMIGIALIEECIKNDVEVLAIIRKNSNRLYRLPQSELLHIVECDLDELETISSEKSYDVFYHLAWAYTSKEYRDDPILQEKNIRYTLDAVNLAKNLGCGKFVGAGSQAEYGKVDHIITPDTPVFPSTAYGMAKYAAGRLSEKLCSQYNLVHVWGRIFSVYGRYDNEGTMLEYAIKQFIKGEKAIFSAAVQIWNYLYEDDAGKIFYLLGEKNVIGGIYAIANYESKILRQYIEEMVKVYGGKVNYEFAPIDAKKSELNLNVDTSKTIQAVGYIPQVTFSEGISKMITYLRLKNSGGVRILVLPCYLSTAVLVYSYCDVGTSKERCVA